MTLYRPELTEGIIGAFFDVWNDLKFGYLESICVSALELELRTRGMGVQREFPVDVYYKGRVVGRQRLDLVVEQSVVLEVKASRVLDPSAEARIMSYLRATKLEVGLILHFGPRPSFRRFISTNRPERFALQP